MSAKKKNIGEASAVESFEPGRRAGNGTDPPTERLTIVETGAPGIGTSKPKSKKGKTEEPKTKVRKKADKKVTVSSVRRHRNPHPPEIWVCIVAGWVRYRGTRYEQGDTIVVQPGKMADADLNILRKYFEPGPTNVVTGVSEPIELLDQGENHDDHSS